MQNRKLFITGITITVLEVKFFFVRAWLGVRVFGFPRARS
jgi:hypothetical protein